MADSQKNDWSGTKARIVSSKEKNGIIKYVKEKGINISELSLFDGSKNLLLEQIDTLSKLKEKYPIGNRNLTIHPVLFEDQGQFGGLTSNGRTVLIEAKSLRDREITIKNIIANNEFAAREPKDIIIHEYGHTLGRKYGTNGIEFARKAYYNVFKEVPSDKRLIQFLRENISQHSVRELKHKNGNVTYQELIPEVLVAHENNPNDFTKELILLMTRGMA